MTLKYTRNVNSHLRYVNSENARRDLSNHALFVMIGPKLWELLSEVGADGLTHKKKKTRNSKIGWGATVA